MGMRPRVTAAAVLTAGLVLPTLLTLPAHATPPPGTRATRAHDVTSALEAGRTAAAPLPDLAWWDCTDRIECAVAELPLDYDSPHGPTTEVAVGRIRAADPAMRIGTLFLNPGGPGGSGIDMVLSARSFLSQDLLDRFDIVGFDPRGTNFSDQVKCFANLREQDLALDGLKGLFPLTAQEESAAVRSAKELGKACSTKGLPLSASMSTAQVARDMDVLRRAFGDDKLSFLGFSYGSELGLTYANMFPDRFRAIVVDGVIDPVAWAGNEKTASTVLDDRLGTPQGAYKALMEILKQCETTTTLRCPLAGQDPVGFFRSLTDRLRKEPLVWQDEDGYTHTVTYQRIITNTLSCLYNPEGFWDIVQDLNVLKKVLDRNSSPAEKAEAGRKYEAGRKKAAARLRDRVSDETDSVPVRGLGSREFPYDNSNEAFSGVACVDGLHPEDASGWPKATAEMDERAPYFGRAWGWTTVQCASNTWTAQDEDAYRGPFNRRTAAPVLVVGAYWDPATSYTGARSAAARMPNAHLLSSDNWGHTSYGTSGCVTFAINQYLLEGTPLESEVCTGAPQPFDRDPWTGEDAPDSAAGKGKILPPITPDPVVQQVIEDR